MPQKKVIISASDISNQPMRPALTPRGRENQMIDLAYDLVEKRLREGTASSAETVHFLKLGLIERDLEIKRTEYELEQIRAKTESLRSEKRIEELYKEAVAAMQLYSGTGGMFVDEEEVIDAEYTEHN